MAVKNKRICITGGAGFIGSQLVSLLVDDNEIVVYDNLHRNALQFAHLSEHKHLHFIKGDVLDYEATSKAIDGCQIVIHCAAIAGVYTVDRSAVRTMEVNLLGTHQVVKAALVANAASVILAHNRPSGVAEASRADRMLTDALKSALATIDIRVLDHIIVAGSKTTSVAERGWL